ncbi:hypothetical protein VS_II1473 [Vibrio atlanticus]|uniref:Uncharacterized protein n=1 Tax=Vibrio atlanticus (strain LGP32) TaxID=575788 RepID=B7VU01_VIBA3|nr:hypothetical protein VS_II1473 [Vibrio atlanticus]
MDELLSALLLGSIYTVDRTIATTKPKIGDKNYNEASGVCVVCDNVGSLIIFFKTPHKCEH